MNIKLYFLLFTLICCIFDSFASEIKSVDLFVTGNGASKKEAIDNALSNALYQSYQVFLMLDGSVWYNPALKDAVTDISSGCVKKYKEISSYRDENSSYNLLLKATINTNKLKKIANKKRKELKLADDSGTTYFEFDKKSKKEKKNKDATIEFDGDIQSVNAALNIVNKQNEEEAIELLINEFYSKLNDCFDYSIEIEKLKFTDKEKKWDDAVGWYDLNTIAKSIKYSKDGSIVYVPIKVKATLNKNGVKAITQLYNDLSKICFIWNYFEEEDKIKSMKFKNEQQYLNYEENIKKEFPYRSFFPFYIKERVHKHDPAFNHMYQNINDSYLLLKSDKSSRFIDNLDSKLYTFLRDITIDFGADMIFTPIELRDQIKKIDNNAKSVIAEDYVWGKNTWNGYGDEDCRKARCKSGEEYYMFACVLPVATEKIKNVKKVIVRHNGNASQN